MLVEATKLHWLGIDMCSRERRRVAVIVTYVAFLVAVWLHPRRTYEVTYALWIGMMLNPLWAQLDESVPRWMKHLIAGLVIAIAGWGIWHPQHRHDDPGGLYGAMFAAMILSLGTVVGALRLVGTAYPGWLASAMRRRSQLSWRGQQKLARQGFLYGLDGFAWNEYGERFKNLTDEQKVLVHTMQSAHPQGMWMTGMERKLVDDERLRLEDNELRARVQRTMTAVLFVSALAWGWAASSGWKIGPDTVAEWAWTLFGLAITLRQAIVLWTEEDPRAVSGELEVLHQQQA